MDSFDHKMSKSDPNNAVILHDSRELLQKKMKKAFLEVGNSSSAVFEITEHVIIPILGEISIIPDPKYGAPPSLPTRKRSSTQYQMGPYTPWMPSSQ